MGVNCRFKEPAPGRYRHYKGGEYEVIGTARHSESDEHLVVYRCLYDNNSLWVRPLSMFTDTVTTVSGIVPRFTVLSDESVCRIKEKTE